MIKEEFRKELMEHYEKNRDEIQKRLREFEDVYRNGNDFDIFLELIFCIFTAGASARMGIKCIEAIKDMVIDASVEELTEKLKGCHMYPEARAKYVIHTRDYLKKELDLKLKDKIESFTDVNERRDFFASNPGIKGLGYKEGSHFLRNIGFKGYGILDKHILRSLVEFGYLETEKPPSTRKKYLFTEDILKNFSKDLGVDFDELDLILWSRKTGVILK